MARSPRRHNTVGTVERKTGLIEKGISKLEKDISSANMEQIIARATFLANSFSGSGLLTSF